MQLLQHLVTDAPDNGCARVEVLVHTVAEAHQPEGIAGVLGPLDVLADVLRAADVLQHPDHGFIGAAMRRAPERNATGGKRGERVDPGTARDPHGGGGAVLFVVRVQHQQRVESPGRHRIGLFSQHHVEEIGGVVEIVARGNGRLADRVAVGGSRHRRDVRNHPMAEAAPVIGVTGICAVRICGGHERERRRHHAHGMGVGRHGRNRFENFRGTGAEGRQFPGK